MNIFAHEIIKWLYKFKPDMVQMMKKSSHNGVIGEGDETISFYSNWHIEGDIWTHTMMVVSNIIRSFETKEIITPNRKELVVAAIFHDLGKPQSLKVCDEKIRFTGHASISTFIANDLLFDSYFDFFTEEQKIYILMLINYHQEMFSLSTEMSHKSVQRFAEKFNFHGGIEFLHDLNILRKADYFGNISIYKDKISREKLNLVFDYLKNKKITNTPKFDKTLTITVGLPGAGKSTYTNHLKNVVSRDKIIMEIGRSQSYNENWKIVDHDFVNEIRANEVDEAFNGNESFVIDETNLSYRKRFKLINYAYQKKFNVEIIVILPSMKKVYYQQSLRNGKNIPDHVTKNMMETFTFPLPSEGNITIIRNN